MKNTIIYILTLLLGICYTHSLFAIEVACPVIKKDYSPESIRAKIDECAEKRAQAKESTITEYYCPSGDFTWQDGRHLTGSTLAYHVAAALFMTQIDEDAMTYMCTLRELRVKDPTSWTEDMKNKIEVTSTSKDSFAKRYHEVCDFSFVAEKINLPPDKIYIDTTDTYPQSVCKQIAKKKEQAWKNMGSILMNEGIAKAWQNEKDTLIDKVKGKYSIIIDKYLAYSRIASRALSNLTAYPRRTIQ